MDTVVVILIGAALAAGLLLGWFIGSRPTADWKARHAERDGAAKEHEENLKRAITELGAAQIELATLKANAENFDKQLQQMKEAREDLLAQFKVAGGEVLSKAQEEFLRTAAEKFGSAEKANKEAVKSLLEPVHQRLKTYEEHINSLESKRIDAFGQIAALMENMHKGQEAVRAEAARLGTAFREAPKLRGSWGERTLRNVLEKCGLAEHADFVVEHTIETEEGRLRPDVIINLPGNRKIVIDAKVSIKAYQDALDANTDEARSAALKMHAKSMKTHVLALAAKSYQSQLENAADYVIMFIPGEHLLAAALQEESDLWDVAFNKGVLLATPTNLVAIARTVEQVWKQDKLAREAVEIGKSAAELYDRLATSAEHLKRVGSGLGTAVLNYNKFVGSFERNVLSAGRRFKDQGVKIGKREIEEINLIEAPQRYASADDE